MSHDSNYKRNRYQSSIPFSNLLQGLGAGAAALAKANRAATVGISVVDTSTVDDATAAAALTQVALGESCFAACMIALSNGDVWKPEDDSDVKGNTPLCKVDWSIVTIAPARTSFVIIKVFS